MLKLYYKKVEVIYCVINEKGLKFLENMEEELASLSQDEFYELLTECGLNGLIKLDTGEGRVILSNKR